MPLPHAALSLAARDLLSVFNAQPGATLLLSPDWVIVGASDDYLTATLTQRATIVGQFIFDAFPDNPQTPEANAVANVRTSLQQVLATCQAHEMAPQHYDVPDPTQPGRFVERHWQPRHTPVLDAQGQVQFIIQSVQDITARRLAERLLRESQDREQAARADAERQRGELQRLFEQAPVAMALFQGPDYVIELANQPMATIWGRTLAQTLGQPVFTALPYVQNQGFEALFAEVLTQGTEHTLPEVPVIIDRAHTDQPTLGYFNLTYRPQRDSHGQITGIFTIAQEVTEQVVARQRVEQLNQELEARVAERTQELARRQGELQRLFEQAPVAIMVLRGPELVVESANAAICDLWGRPAEQVLGRPYFEAMPDMAGQGFEQMLAGVLATGQSHLLHEVPVLLDRAHTSQPVMGNFNFEFKALYGPDEHAGPVGVLAVGNEVTAQVRARQVMAHSQQQVHHLNEELAALNQELHATNVDLGQSNTQLTRTNVDLDNFVYTASHDLKAPISNLEGLLTTLREELPPQAGSSEVTYILHLMQDSIARFTRTLSLLTDVTKLQHTFSESPAPVALVPLIEDVRLDLALLLEQVDGRLHVDVAATPTLTFSEKNLRSVVHNLLSNAFKYHDPARPAAVTIRSRAEASYLVLEVQDNGLGLDLSGDHELFSLFRRFHTHVEGTGVGLHMVKKLVENAGGKIEVASKLGQGSTFSVYFPR
jgi:signal transduction histidine kinase/PAS domain-containing protein